VTLRGARLLAKADIVFYDALVEEAMLHLCPQALKISVGKRCGERSTAQRFINQQLIDAAQTHGCVVRLKGGDPMLFGRAREEIDALSAANIQVEVIPGVSAAFGASADLMQSLTQRGVSRSVLFVTPRVGHGETEYAWAKSAATADTVVLYMAGQQAGAIAQALMAAGLPGTHPSVMIENATLPEKRIIPARLCDLANAARQLEGGPALLFVGAVYEELVGRAERVVRNTKLPAK
jgi:uroporphyrin-III C-methyltransferase